MLIGTCGHHRILLIWVLTSKGTSRTASQRCWLSFLIFIGCERRNSLVTCLVCINLHVRKVTCLLSYLFHLPPHPPRPVLHSSLLQDCHLVLWAATVSFFSAKVYNRTNFELSTHLEAYGYQLETLCTCIQAVSTTLPSICCHIKVRVL